MRGEDCSEFSRGSKLLERVIVSVRGASWREDTSTLVEGLAVSGDGISGALFLPKVVARAEGLADPA